MAPYVCISIVPDRGRDVMFVLPIASSLTTRKGAKFSQDSFSLLRQYASGGYNLAEA